MDQKRIKQTNEKWLTRDYKEIKEKQKKKNHCFKIDFRNASAILTDEAKAKE